MDGDDGNPCSTVVAVQEVPRSQFRHCPENWLPVNERVEPEPGVSVHS